MEQNIGGLPLQQLEDRPDILGRVPLEFSAKDTFSAAYDLGFESTALASIKRMMQLSDANKQGPKVSASELNAKYTDLPDLFREPMTEAAAELIASRHETRQKKQFISANGPSAYYQKEIINFAGGVIPHALDPLEFAAGAAIGGGLGVAGKALIAGGKYARLGGVLAQHGAFNSVLGSVVSGTLGNIATEPLAIAAAQSEMDDYTLLDAFQGAVGGALAGLGINMGLRGIKSTYGFLRSGSPQKMATTFKTALGQFISGGKVDVIPLVEDLRADVNSAPVGGFQKLKAVDIPARTFYMVGDGRKQIGMDLGEATYLTPELEVANGVGAQRIQGYADDISEVRFRQDAGPVKVLDLDEMLSPENIPTLKEAVDRVLGEGNFAKLERGALSGEELLQRISERPNGLELVQNVQKELKSLGVDALTHTKGDGLPGGEGKYNSLVVLSPEKLEVLNSTPAKNSYEPPMEQVNALRQKTLSYENSRNYNKETMDALDQVPEIPPFEVRELQKLESEIIEQFDELEKLNQLDASVVRAKEKFKEDMKLDQLIDSTINMARHCVGRS